MANLIDQKLSSTDFSGKNIQALPTKPTITAEQLKERFDYAAEQVVAPKHNALVDILTDTTEGVSGSEQIGSAPISGVAGETVHEQMADLKYQFDNVLLDPRVFPDGSVTTARLMDEAVTLEKIDPDALAWNNISSKPAAFTPSTHTHAAGDLPAASTAAPGVVQLDSLVNSTSEVRAATSLAVKTVNDKVVALEGAHTPRPAVWSSGNNFTVTDPNISSYIEGKVYTFYFDHDSTAPQVRINALAYMPLVCAGTTPLAVKALQMVSVYVSVSGLRFFAVSAGGGIELPNAITAGEYPVKVYTDLITLVGSDVTPFSGVIVRTIKIHKAGNYRIKWDCGGCASNLNSSATIERNGAQIEIISITGYLWMSKTVDCVLDAGDVITLRLKTHSVTSSSYTQNKLFGVYRDIPELTVAMLSVAS